MKLTWVLSFLIAACSNNSNNASFQSTADFVEISGVPGTEQPPPPLESFVKADLPEKKIRKSGSISFQSQDLEKDYAQIKSLLPHHKAYFENESQSNDQFRKQYQISIRVEGPYFDSLMNAISKLAWRIEHKHANVDDVTEQYYDLKTRIENKKVLEQRYRELLAKANLVKDILEIEKNINEVRTDIEMMQGQFNYLSSQIQFSNLQVQFYEELPYAASVSQKRGFGTRIMNALGNGWNGLLTILVGLITLWPFYLLGLAVYFLVVFLKNRSKKTP